MFIVNVWKAASKNKFTREQLFLSFSHFLVAPLEKIR